MEMQGNAVDTLLGGIEAGGTKFNCVVAAGINDIRERASFPTTDPEHTLSKVAQFFHESSQRHGTVCALGIASFGPVNLDPESAYYGYITQTPKAGWSNTNMAGYFSQALSVPVAFDTDVNGAALGEHLCGAAIDVKNFVYVTIGTGIGAGIMIDGQLINGSMHPEIGHMLMPRDSQKDSFKGNCPFHNNCLEGLASGPAIEERWGLRGQHLEQHHPAWDLEAEYLATMCVNLTSCYSPQRIILGGGVMIQAHLFNRIRQKFLALAGGYFPQVSESNIERYIVAPKLVGRSGEVGSLRMAQHLYNTKNVIA
ncbi:ROK family protein [Microbulbifer sp. TRSA002]|uniref:ROK family protein n=1 Tax=Microbulbifer sp. TRSA002 TaxID=3243382 RepID=UPI00403A7329